MTFRLRSTSIRIEKMLQKQPQAHSVFLQESFNFMINFPDFVQLHNINTIAMALFTCVLISLIACKQSEVTGEECQSPDDLYMITQSFDTSKYADIDFLISFTSSDSWGKYANSILIFRRNDEYQLESSFVLKRNGSSKRDTTSFMTILPKEKIDSILNSVNQLGCNAYRLSNVVVMDENNKYFVYKNGNSIKGWMWQDGFLSARPGGERFVDSMCLKALALEGMLYRYCEAGEPHVAYSFDSACENDSIKVGLYYVWGDYISQSIVANHPKFTFQPVVEGYLESYIPCRDTVSLAKDLEVIVTTKESKKISIKPKQYRGDY